MCNNGVTNTHPTAGLTTTGWLFQFGPIDVDLTERPFLHEVMWLYAVKSRDRRLPEDVRLACCEVVAVCQSKTMQNHGHHRRRAFTDRMVRPELTQAQLAVFTEANEWMQLVRN